MNAMKAKYLMITSWDDHWDKKKRTHYSTSMFREGMRKELIENNATTIFIRVNKKTNKVEKAWIGTVFDFDDKGKKIDFSVNIEKEIHVDTIPKEFQEKPDGWYFIGEREIFIGEREIFIGEREILEENLPSEHLLFYPPFFYILIETRDWKIFEDYTYYLLKLIGINEIYKFEKQRGEADGFFKIQNLAVIYDTTLDEDFEKNKITQINNYVNQLRTNPFIIPGTNKQIEIDQCRREVWIITRGQSRIVMQRGDVYVMEISIHTLFKIFYLRLKKINNDRELEEILRSIEK
jgi:hypothetical protein